MSDKLMDTEAGGEQTQYEGANTFTKSHAKQEGTFGETNRGATEADLQANQEKHERGERTAENIRYGQAISEGGMGGQTTTSTGAANNRDFGREPRQESGEDGGDARRAQQYGPGSGVGG